MCFVVSHSLNMNALASFVFIATLCCCCDSAKVLTLFYLPSYSHYILGHRLSEELQRKGHDVTFVHSFDKYDDKVKYRSVHLDKFMEKLMSTFKSDDGKEADMSKMHPIATLFMMQEFALLGTRFVLDHKAMQPVLKDKYDVVIIEQFQAESLKGLCHKFDAPCIGFSSLGSGSMSNYAVGNPAPSSYVPNYFLTYSYKMNLPQRVFNFIYNGLNDLLRELYYISQQDKLLHEYFPSAPHVQELVKGTSLLLLNSHPSVTQPVPHVPAMIEIGGFHVTPPGKLPKDLQKFMDDAKEGVVLFSIGSHAKFSTLEKKTQVGIVKALGRIPMKVLFKVDLDNVEDKPSNLVLSKWVPQPEVLAHPNLKLFVTHGGLLSTIEACYHGVPLVGVPVFADQRMNMAHTVVNGVGLMVPLDELNEDNLYEAINTVIKDKSFKETAMRRSKLLHDQPMKPIDLATYWIEYVIRHKNLDHLKSAALDLRWYQLHNLDVLLVIALAITIPLLLVRAVCKKICNSFCKSKKTDTNKKTN